MIYKDPCLTGHQCTSLFSVTFVALWIVFGNHAVLREKTTVFLFEIVTLVEEINLWVLHSLVGGGMTKLR